MRSTGLIAAVLLAGGGACGARPLAEDAGTVSGNAFYAPCERGTVAGGAFVRLMTPQAMSGVPDGVGYTEVSAVVRDGADPFDWSITEAVEGPCRLLARPTCAPECAAGTTCFPGNRCEARPTYQDVGTITFHGFAVPLELAPIGAGAPSYSGSIGEPFPPVAPDAPVTVETSGGAYAPFSLEARGVELLTSDGADLSIGRGRSLDLTWTPPARPGAARIQALLQLQSAVGGPLVECTFADTGAASIPASLVEALLDRGINSAFPRVTLARRTVTSTMIAPGCVMLDITAPVRRRITIDGVTMCDGTSACPPPLTCQPNYTCG